MEEGEGLWLAVAEGESDRGRCRFQYLSSHSANFGAEQCPLSHFHEKPSAE